MLSIQRYGIISAKLTVQKCQMIYLTLIWMSGWVAGGGGGGGGGAGQGGTNSKIIFK